MYILEGTLMGASPLYADAYHSDMTAYRFNNANVVSQIFPKSGKSAV